jgi:CheY-like chemotaxis protein
MMMAACPAPAHPRPGDALAGRRVLLVEDNYLVAEMLTQQIESMGCEVVGPAASSAEALDLLDRHEIDCAVLDINIIGGTSAPIAEALDARAIPFLFVTGYGSPRMLPDQLKRRLRINKPVNDRVLRRAIEEALAGGAGEQDR